MKKTILPRQYQIIHESAADPNGNGIGYSNIEVIIPDFLPKNTTPDHVLVTIEFDMVLQTGADGGITDVNWNNRKWVTDKIISALDRNPIVQHNIKMNTFTNEYGHPVITKVDNWIERQMTVLPDRACDKIIRYWKDKNLVMGRCVTLSDGYGQYEKNRILTGHPVMKSNRSVGVINPDGTMADNINIRCFDSVETPSHKGAYMVGLEGFKYDPKITSFNEGVGIFTMHDSAFKNFIIQESSSEIELLCNAMNIDPTAIKVTESGIHLQTITSTDIETIIIPFNEAVNAEIDILMRL